MIVGVASLLSSFSSSGTYAIYIIKRQNCLNICNTVYKSRMEQTYRGNFFSKLINVHALLFGTLQQFTIEYKHIFFNGILPSLLKLQDWSSITRSFNFSRILPPLSKWQKLRDHIQKFYFSTEYYLPLSKWQNLIFHTWKLYFFQTNPNSDSQF